MLGIKSNKKMSEHFPTLELDLNKRMESNIESVLRNVIGKDASFLNSDFFNGNDSTDEEKDDAFDTMDYGNIFDSEEEKEGDSSEHSKQHSIKTSSTLNFSSFEEEIASFNSGRTQKSFTQILHHPQELTQTYFQKIPVSPSVQYSTENVTSSLNQSPCVYSSNLDSYYYNQQQIQPNTNFNKNDAYWSHLEFLLNKTKKIDKFVFSQVSGNIQNILLSPQGAKIFHTYFHNTSSQILNWIFNEIAEHLIDLLTVSHSHYALLKLYDYISSKNKLFFLNIITHNFLLLSTHKISTYFIQNLIERLSTIKEKQIIINSIHNFLMELSLNKYGTHVICKIIIHFEYQYISSIISFVINNFMLLALNGNGLCIVKKVVALENSTQKMFYLIIKDILFKNAEELIQNPYGNYVLQVALDSWIDPNDIEQLIFCFLPSLISLSLQKFSSNVIEKSFEKNSSFLSQFISYLSNERVGDLRRLLGNNFGNYVLQKALKLCNPYEYQLLISLINHELEHSLDKKMLTKWYKFCSQNNF